MKTLLTLIFICSAFCAFSQTQKSHSTIHVNSNHGVINVTDKSQVLIQKNIVIDSSITYVVSWTEGTKPKVKYFKSFQQANLFFSNKVEESKTYDDIDNIEFFKEEKIAFYNKSSF